MNGMHIHGLELSTWLTTELIQKTQMFNVDILYCSFQPVK
jgi:hypothetical protein